MGDGDGDGDVDLKDFYYLLWCINSFGESPLSCRNAFDMNGDQLVDVNDAAIWNGIFLGPA